MDHNLGQIDLITWQARRNRRMKSGVSPIALVMVAAGLLGLAGAVGQSLGLLHLPGVLALVPAGLVVLAAGVQLVAAVRAALVWLGG